MKKTDNQKAAKAEKKAPVKPAEKTKKRKRRKLSPTSVKVIAIFAVICVTAFVAVILFGGIGFSDVEDSARQFVSGKGTGAGYPYKISSSDVVKMEPFKSNVAVLTTDTMVVLSPSAKEVARFHHGYADPSMSTYNGRALVYDRSSGKFSIMNSSKYINGGSTDSAIYTASMGKDGTVAFSVKSGTAQSELLVYNARMEKIFAWKCADEKIFDIAIAPNGKGAAVILVGSESAQTYSKLVILDFSKSEPVSEFKYDNTVLFKVIYPSKNTVTAFGTDFKTTITKKPKREDDFNYGSSEIAKLSVSQSGKSAIVLSEYGNEDKQNIVLFDKRSKKRFEKAYDEKIYAISCTDKYLAVLFENRVELLRNSGDKSDGFETGKNGKRIVCIGESVYVLYSSNISKNS